MFVFVDKVNPCSIILIFFFLFSEMTKRDYSGRQYSKQASLLLAKSLPISVPIMPDRLNGDEYDEVSVF